MQEDLLWMPIVGYEGYYEVSNYGDVRSLDRIVGGNGEHAIKGKMLSLHESASGYLQVNLNKGGTTKPKKVHRLVAEAFIARVEGKNYIDHINTNRKDNRVCNLRWVSLKENSRNPLSILHAKHIVEKNEIKKSVKITKFKEEAKNKPIKLYRYRKDGTFVDSFCSLLNAEVCTKIEIGGIKKALNKRHRTAGGFLWTTKYYHKIEPYKRLRHTKCKTILMIDENDRVVREWDAVRDAAKELGTTHTRIIRYMKEKIPLNGYWFKYR